MGHGYPHPRLQRCLWPSSKGLEFPIVCIPGLGFMPNSYGEPDDEARLLYVAMTRAMEQLVMTCDRQSAFVERLETMVGEQPQKTIQGSGARTDPYSSSSR